MIVRRALSSKLAALKYGGMRFDFKSMEANLPYLKQNALNRQSDTDPSKVQSLWQRYKKQLFEVEQMRKRKNQHASTLPPTASAKEQHREQGKYLKTDLEKMEQGLTVLESELMQTALTLPNLTHPDVPLTEPKLIELRNQRKPENWFLDHLELGKIHDLFDFDTASDITGSKFVIYKNQAVLLEQALINWALQHIATKGYQLLAPPDICRQEILAGCGFRPRDPAGQIYNLEGGKLSLIGTAEIPLAGLYANSSLERDKLPLRLGGLSHCFRMEAGKGGLSKGLYRLHQFTKVEMFTYCLPDHSEQEHQAMLAIQQELLDQLNLPYRVLDMPCNDLGASAYRKYDIEVFMPSRKDYGEVTSTSNCTDYQSVRLNTMLSGPDKTPVHTVNGTACAVPRIMLSLLEWYQQPDHSIQVPECLRLFLPFATISR